MNEQADKQAPLYSQGQVEERDPLRLDIPDEKLSHVIDNRIRSSVEKFESKEVDLRERQERNKRYLFGDQVDENRLHPSSQPYMENIIFESQMRNKPIALSRLPDLLVNPGNETPESDRASSLLTDLINSDMRKRENRKVLGLAYRHRPVYFYSVIKARWNPEKDNYEFINVHPQNVVMDESSNIPDVDEMSFFAEFREMTIKEAVMMFPSKEQELYTEIGFEEGDEFKEAKMASKIKVWEVWFDYHDPTTNELTGEKEWTKVSGVVWKYKDLILHKMKNPYWDWEGESQSFEAEMKEKREISEDEVYQLMFGGDRGTRIFNNYLGAPSKPYYLMTYHHWGELPIDPTSEIEQVLQFQDNVNIMGRHIHDMNVRSRGKEAFSSEYLDSETIDKYDPNDPDQHIKVQAEDVRKAVQHIDMPPAPAQMYNSKQEMRSIAFEMLALNATTRGTRETGDETLGARQMMREQDFGVIDDMVEETINPAAEWMAKWSMQFIKLFYTSGKMRRLVGEDGESVYELITQDLVDDGMEVSVGASGVDKLQRKRQAVMDAQMGMSDPLSYFEDTEQHNPKERAKRVMIFQMSPEMYMQQFVEERDTAQQAQALMQQPPNVPQPQGGQPPQGQPPQQPPQAGMGGGMPGYGMNQEFPPQQGSNNWYQDHLRMQNMGGGNPGDPLGLFT